MLHNRSNQRRLVRRGEPQFSHASIFNSMEQFVQTVSEMDETILIPSRLLDFTVGDSDDRVNLEGKRGAVVKATLSNTNLYRLYDIINQTKSELLWSWDRSNDSEGTNEDFMLAEKIKRVRYSSTTSMQSVQSTVSTSSDSESDAGIENEDAASMAARTFKRHLSELDRSIQKMTLAAQYLTMRYQADVDGQL